MSPSISDPEPWSACRRVIARHSRSFDLASRLFPRDRRNEVSALYGWCRHCDDAIDLPPAAALPGALQELRDGIHGIYAGEAQADPVLHCFQLVIQRRRIPIEYPLELIEGMAMDVEGARYPDVDSLLRYCWRVAGTVGLMMCHVMGVSDARAAVHAAHLGIGMQLTNICRDVVEDWERRRLYVPASLFEADLAVWLGEQLKEETPAKLPASARPQLASAARELLTLADRYYASADAGLRYLEPRSALAVRAARWIYAEIDRCIEARGFDVMQGRAVVSGRRKGWLALRAVGRFAIERTGGRAAPLRAPDTILSAGEVTTFR